MLMNGQLRVESQPGIGSTFSFAADFPVVDDRRNPAPSTSHDHTRTGLLEKPLVG
jgi:hypothetical protein